MTPYFFRVEHCLLRSESFKELGGSAVKVYLTVGLYSDFGSDWAYPSIRTIASQAGLSRQTVLQAIEELTRRGLLATNKSKGRSTAYQIIREVPDRPTGTGKSGAKADRRTTRADPAGDESGLNSLRVRAESVPETLEVGRATGPNSLPELAQFLGLGGPEDRPYQEPRTREDHTTIPIPGTPFRLDAAGQLVVVADLRVLLKEQGIPERLADRFAVEKKPEAVAKVLLNALYLQSQGKLQNGPGYIRKGVEDGYELLPQVVQRLEAKRRELDARLRSEGMERERRREATVREGEEAAINLVIASLRPDELHDLVGRALATLPEPIVRRNPTLSNPFVRGKVYELACGEPLD